MFYVSSLSGGKIGVTDTKDNIEEFLTEKQVLEYYNEHHIHIYGISYSYKKDSIESSVLEFHDEMLSYKLSELFYNFRRISGPRSSDIYAFANYLAGAEVWSTLYVDYNKSVNTAIPSWHSTENVVARFVKDSWDRWAYCDDSDDENGKWFTNIGVVHKLISMTKYCDIIGFSK